ncbi:hypothetical protein L2D08_13285 [Domibacillus sp. PGB-M46]|uniref:hypothetical protein n=1 Tax=Domibacillus sp. PGB-M46 TaxID=2910255 RepID=UPI001F598565|nr:hypothetical protein [Domibacillus sp. PGB-M46]MCI2255341.1 hypothetical protein [Domibacillus sp. PGB-M46]
MQQLFLIAFLNELDFVYLFYQRFLFMRVSPPKNMSKENQIAFFSVQTCSMDIKKDQQFPEKMIDRNPDKYKAVLQKGGRHLPEWDNCQLT